MTFQSQLFNRTFNWQHPSNGKSLCSSHKLITSPYYSHLIYVQQATDKSCTGESNSELVYCLYSCRTSHRRCGRERMNESEKEDNIHIHHSIIEEKHRRIIESNHHRHRSIFFFVWNMYVLLDQRIKSILGMKIFHYFPGIHLLIGKTS
jgi:hypothetical protein